MSDNPTAPIHDAVATLRHDLRTPLNQIIGYSEILQEDAVDAGNTSARDDLSRILTASRRLLAMINVVADPNQIQLLKELPNLKNIEAEAPTNPTLPTKVDLDLILPKIAVEESVEPEVVPLYRATILIVDDEPVNCDLLARRLVQEGYQVVPAYSGADALDKLRSDLPIDIVLLDVLMPGMGGFEVLVTIKNDEILRHIPVIMISALDQLESVVRCIQNGADDYLGKPFNLTFLRARIGGSLDRKRLRDHEQQIYQTLKKTQEDLVIEQEKSEMLLLNMLPKAVANLLREGNHTIADHYSAATILFADLADFTVLSHKIPPLELVELLNEVFMRFDLLADKYGVEKIKTIGDCYMVASGVPVPRIDHAVALVQMGLDMLECVRNTEFRGRNLSFRIGVNSGPVVAGVIGRKKFIYDLWGDAVNTASRMESHGMKDVIQITRSTYELIKDDFDCASQGVLNIKGKGEMEVWHVLTRKSRPSIPGST